MDGDLQIFRSLFAAFYQRFQINSNTAKWSVPVSGGFQNSKTGLIESLNFCMSGNARETVLEDN